MFRFGDTEFRIQQSEPSSNALTAAQVRVPRLWRPIHRDPMSLTRSGLPTQVGVLRERCTALEAEALSTGGAPPPRAYAHAAPPAPPGPAGHAPGHGGSGDGSGGALVATVPSHHAEALASLRVEKRHLEVGTACCLCVGGWVALKTLVLELRAWIKLCYIFGKITWER